MNIIVSTSIQPNHYRKKQAKVKGRVTVSYKGQTGCNVILEMVRCLWTELLIKEDYLIF